MPEADGPMTPELVTALRERRDLMEARAHHLAANAVATDATWLQPLGPRPAEPESARVWDRHASTVAAYRDRYAITGTQTLGDPTASTNQQHDAAAAAAAIESARRATRDPLVPARVLERTGPTRTGITR